MAASVPAANPPRKVEVAERELQTQSRSQMDRIEQGLVWVDREVPTQNGPMDHLAIDQDGTPVVVELKVDPSAVEAGLVQAMDYVAWVRENPGAVAQFVRARRPEIPVKDQDGEARIIIVAPNFSRRVLSAVRVLAPPISLLRYTVYEHPAIGRYLHCDETSDSTEAPTVRGGPTAYSIEEKFKGGRARLRPAYLRLIERATATLGPFETYAKQQYIGMKKDFVFCSVEFYSDELYLLFNLGGLITNERLRSTEGEDWGWSRMTHYTSIREPEQVDDELLSWLKTSYSRS